MKLAFIADIHGNAEALDAVLQDIACRNIDQICILGDLCFRGPEPKRTLDIVRKMNTEVIKGNADEWVVRGIKEGEVPKHAFSMMNKERDWTYARLDKKDLAYLSDLPEELHLEFGKVRIHAFHAVPNSLFDMVQPSESDTFMMEKLMIEEADIYIYAHIHKAFIRYINGKCVINTGSIGLPFDGWNMPSYAIVDLQKDSCQCSIIRVTYQVEKVIEQIKESGYPNVDFMVRTLM